MMENSSLNYLDEAYSQYVEFENLSRFIIPVLFGAVFLMGCVGNTFVLIVSFKFKDMKTINNTMIVALATADLCFLTFCVPFTAIGYTLQSYPFGNIWCKISNYIIYVSAYVSIYVMCLMSVDRFLAIVYPLSSRRFRTKTHTYIGMAGVICFSFVLSIQALFHYEFMKYSYYEEERSICGSAHANEQKMFLLTFSIFAYFVPFVVLTAMNGSIFITMLKRQSFLPYNLSRNARAVKVVFACEVGFFVCWTPLHVVFFLKSFTNLGDSMMMIIVQMIANVFAYSNSCLNPILYTFICKEYREKMKELFKVKN